MKIGHWVAILVVCLQTSCKTVSTQESHVKAAAPTKGVIVCTGTLSDAERPSGETSLAGFYRIYVGGERALISWTADDSNEVSRDADCASNQTLAETNCVTGIDPAAKEPQWSFKIDHSQGAQAIVSGGFTNSFEVGRIEACIVEPQS